MIKRAAVAMLLLGIGLSTGGCLFQALPWLMAVTAPPEKVEAEYEPAPESTILVWVEDNPANEATAEGSLRYRLTNELNRQLLAAGIVENVIDPHEVVSLQIADPSFGQMSMGDVAKAVGADLVLHVEIADFALRDTPMNPLWHGRLATYIQVFDDTGTLLWPDDRLDGFPVQPVEIKTSSSVSPSYGAKLTQLLVLAEADHITRLLYDHEVDPLDASRDRRLESVDMAGLTFDD